MWGFTGHPLIDGQKLIYLVGGAGSVAVAFDKDTGKELWRALTAKEPGYCPPTIIELAANGSSSSGTRNPSTPSTRRRAKFIGAKNSPREWA